MAKTLEERMKIIDAKVEKDTNAEIEKANQLLKEKKELILKIINLSDRIDILLKLVNYCREKGLALPDNNVARDHGYGNGDYNFCADGIYHHVGFMELKYHNNDNYKCKFLGIYNGGYYGKYDFYTNGIKVFNVHEDTKEIVEPKISDMRRFLKEFDLFEKSFLSWVDSLDNE